MKAGINLKSGPDIAKMKEGGKLLGEIKAKLKEEVKVGVSAWEIERLASSLIEKTGGSASFKMVPGYSWATCVSVNAGVVHGIPKKEIVFKKGDVVSVDVGLFYKGFHTDTSITVGLEVDNKVAEFLKVGKRALDNAIKKAVVGNRVYDLSKAMQDTVESAGYYPVGVLVGHGIGRSLHEEPAIPCVVVEERENTVELVEGMVIAIEIMYGLGTGEVYKEEDGWTISMRDDKISGLFEETVALDADGSFVLTKID